MNQPAIVGVLVLLAIAVWVGGVIARRKVGEGSAERKAEALDTAEKLRHDIDKLPADSVRDELRNRMRR
jgi:Na+-transporting methylmalonyl-CoA/oxaloacetate decarboxylase gamma subunit